MQVVLTDADEFERLMKSARIVMKVVAGQPPERQSKILACAQGMAAANQHYPELGNRPFAALIASLMEQAWMYQHVALEAERKAPDDGGDPAKAPTVSYGGRA